MCGFILSGILPKSIRLHKCQFFVLCLFLYSIQMFLFYSFDFIETSVIDKVAKHEIVILANKKTVLLKTKP